ncbi:MAG: hypothetical protein HY934_04425 [Candidatus Firestonebacteria bacterium]|nr:hypothetical protein [Candidatus Firestonebacteria bacterium]
MRKKVRVCKILLISIGIIMFFMINVKAIDIAATGGWTQTITSANLISGAGSNLVNTYQSATNATRINITNCINNNDNWRVDINRTDVLWDAGFVLSARRTSNGTGGGSINGGIAYMVIPTAAQQFFTGSGNRSTINIRYRLSGMSITISPNNYSTIITYTVVDI